jgi:hypothetical protein
MSTVKRDDEPWCRKLETECEKWAQVTGEINDSLSNIIRLLIFIFQEGALI